MNSTGALAAPTSDKLTVLHRNASLLLQQLYNEFKDDLWQHKRTINVILISLYAVIFLTGVVGNVAALAAFGANRRLRSQSSFFLVNLLVSDLLGK